MSSFSERIEREARPGESWSEVAARLDRGCKIKATAAKDERADFFILEDRIAAKDNRHFMYVALFRMSKRQSRAGEVIRYDLPDGYIEVKAGPDGMASVWDYDIVLMLISYLTEAQNRQKNGRGAIPSRYFTPRIADILKFCRRGDGGNQAQNIESALDRLKGTTIKSMNNIPSRNGKGMIREVESESLIGSYRVISETTSGRADRVEIEAPGWIYKEIVHNNKPTVLTVNADYFLIDSAIGRFIYRLARRAAGNSSAKWGFKTIYERSGLTCFKEYCRILRRLIKSDSLPDYHLSEETGQSGPQLIMTHRSTHARLVDGA